MKSMFRLRSCASSMISVSYCVSSRSPESLGEQDAVGHHLDVGAVADPVGEAHLVADGFAQRGAYLLGDPLGHGARRDAPRLGVPDQSADPATQLQADLWQLGGLARAGLPGDDDDLVVADRGKQVVLLLADRQGRGIADLGHPGAALLDALAGPGDLGGYLVELCLPEFGLAHRVRAVETAPKALLIVGREVTELAP